MKPTQINYLDTFSILCYHGICADEADFGEFNSSGKHISASIFEDQIAHIAKNYTVVTMTEIGDLYLKGLPVPAQSVAVTFDDGFANNVSHAWPILEKYGVPATFYLTTGYVDTDRVMRMDVIEAVVFSSGLKKLEFEVEDRFISLGLETAQSRKESFFELKRFCKSLPQKLAEKMIESLLSVAPDPEIFRRSEYMFMTWDDARRMDQSELIELGAHTVDHFPLSTLDDSQVEFQVLSSLQKIEEELNKRCTHFAYPEGRLIDYDERTISLLIDKNITLAPNAVNGCNLCHSINPYHLNRVLVGMDGNSFPL